ncbi:LysR substrate-binding domain-containing protein [Sinimarinibacterium sp. CAU 1509]|uniref:LysR substrate-binding domain-containing protein n=1 Tax=Sinimarinibacterium sp. CAU 1509 TaxID=2562283 RepID=UPI001469C9CD|nr:LysR substrate-binding domain-containing protein [Sinimarinibacterium sp. CAU 1509]
MNDPQPVARLRLSSLNLLRAFEAAARHQSFKLAGEELCVTASAISQQVRQLESQLGVILFERQPRGLALTETGRGYLADIQPHLTALLEATERVRRATQQSVLRVSLMPPLASRVVLPRLADFRAQHPQVALRINTSVRNVDLSQRQVDLAIRYGVPPWPGCVHEKLVDLQIQAIAPPALAARFDLRRHPERLSQAPRVVMTERPDAWRQYFMQAGVADAAAADNAASEVFHVDDYPAAIEAAETVGVALAILPLERPLIASGRVVAVGPAYGPMPQAMYAVMLDDRRGNEAIAAFIDWVRRRLAEIA